MTKLGAVFLGLVQGIAEFLPISSSGHLSIFQNLFGMSTAEDTSLLFDVFLHLGTLISVCIVYWKDIVGIVTDCIAMVQRVGHPVPGEKKKYPGHRLLVMMFFACMPLFLILPLQDQIERLYQHTGFIGFALLSTGTMLYISDRMNKGTKNETNMTIADALLIGLCEGIATIPGLSRSGTTITAGMAVGLDRSFSVKFSFLISLPAILAANILTLVQAMGEGIDTSMLPTYLLGALVSLVFGYLSLRLLKYIAEKGKFGRFAYYCWFAGILTILLTIIL